MGLCNLVENVLTAFIFLNRYESFVVMETIAISTSSEYSLVDGNAASLDSLSEIDVDNTILEISYSFFDT